MPATLKVFPSIIPPTPCSPFQLSRSFISNLGRDVPLLRSPPFPPYGRRVQVPSFSILPALASPLRPLPPLHICIPTLPRHPDPRTRTHPWPPPSTTRPGSHLGGSAAAAQKAALLQLGSGCCSRLLLYLLLLLSSPRCPRPDPERCHSRYLYGVQEYGYQPQISSPTLRPLASSPLGLNSRSFLGPRPWPPGTDTP